MERAVKTTSTAFETFPVPSRTNLSIPSNTKLVTVFIRYFQETKQLREHREKVWPPNATFLGLSSVGLRGKNSRSGLKKGFKFLDEASSKNISTKAIDKILNQDGVGLFLGMGLGKTSCTLTAINHLINIIKTIQRC